MKISTWNIERPTKSAKRLSLIKECLKSIDSDILILTETNVAVQLGGEYTAFHTVTLPEPYYKEGERRASIYSKYPLIEKINTFSAVTSICVKLKTPLGDLTVYGTVLGVFGNRRNDFKEDVENHLKDFEEISRTNELCIAGDLNMSFSDNYYYTQEGRQKLNDIFEKLQLENLTAGIPNNIDHIILPKKFIANKKVTLHPWNVPIDKRLSDHMGVSVSIV